MEATWHRDGFKVSFNRQFPDSISWFSSSILMTDAETNTQHIQPQITSFSSRIKSWERRWWVDFGWTDGGCSKGRAWCCLKTAANLALGWLHTGACTSCTFMNLCYIIYIYMFIWFGNVMSFQLQHGNQQVSLLQLKIFKNLHHFTVSQKPRWTRSGVACVGIRFFSLLWLLW